MRLRKLADDTWIKFGQINTTFKSLRVQPNAQEGASFTIHKKREMSMAARKKASSV